MSEALGLSAPRHRRRFGLRAAFAASLWIVALGTVLLVVAGLEAPRSTTEVAARVAEWLRMFAIAAALIGTLALIAWPPAIPWLRLWWKEARDRMRVDHGPMLEATARLEHFESAADHLIVGRTLLRIGQPNRALRHLMRAVELEPDAVQNAYFCGRALLAVGAYPVALRALTHAAKLDPEYAFGDLLIDLARAQMRNGQPEAAEQTLARHEQRFGAAPTVDLLRAQLAVARDEPERAREFFSRAAAKPPVATVVSPRDRLARARARVGLLRLGGSSR